MKLFSRIENWLLIVTIILILVEGIFFSRSAFDLHFHDTYFVITNLYLGMAFLVILLLPYLFHLFLRLKYKRSGKICEAHVILSLITILVFFIIIETGQIKFRKYYDFSNWQSYEQRNDYLFLLSLLFLLLQVLFILYALVKLIMKRRKIT
jgi:heme/copper-type cytochrome/quinol oxidase subunit 1